MKNIIGLILVVFVTGILLEIKCQDVQQTKLQLTLNIKYRCPKRLRCSPYQVFDYKNCICRCIISSPRCLTTTIFETTSFTTTLPTPNFETSTNFETLTNFETTSSLGIVTIPIFWTIPKTTASLETSTVSDTTTSSGTSTISDTTTSSGTSTISDTSSGTSTISDTTTSSGTSTISDTTTSSGTSTLPDTTTSLETSTLSDTTTSLGTSTISDTTTSLATTTTSQTTTPVIISPCRKFSIPKKSQLKTICITNEMMTTTDAAIYCKSIGADLFTIPDIEHYNALKNLVTDYFGSPIPWIIGNAVNDRNNNWVLQTNPNVSVYAGILWSTKNASRNSCMLLSGDPLLATPQNCNKKGVVICES